MLRQPFGGFGKSVFGPAMKAGGPNYVAQFMHFMDRPQGTGTEPQHPRLAELCRAFSAGGERLASVDPDELRRIATARGSYDRHYREEFSREHDHFRLLGQDNVRCYLPLCDVRVLGQPRQRTAQRTAVNPYSSRFT